MAQPCSYLSTFIFSDQICLRVGLVLAQNPADLAKFHLFQRYPSFRLACFSAAYFLAIRVYLFNLGGTIKLDLSNLSLSSLTEIQGIR